MPLAGKRILVVSEDQELARVIAAASARLGASAVVCPGGRAALEEVDRAGVDGALLDLPVPDFRPDALLLAMRSRGVKMVAVSGVFRAARFAATAVRFGAAAFFEKPFEVHEALAAIGSALSSGTLPPEPAPAPPAQEDPTATYPLPDDLGSYIFAFAEARPFLDETLPGIPLARPLEGLAAPLPPTSAPAASGRPGSPSLPEGDLAITSVPRLLAALHTTRATGALTLARPPVKKLLLLQEGRTVFGASNVPSERFGVRCVREGILSAEDLQVLAASLGPREPLNEALLARGLLDEARRTRMFEAQIREILWSTFAWREGTYRLLAGLRARRPIAPTDLRTGDLILEGFRRAMTLERLREDVPRTLALATGAAPAFAVHELPMSQQEARMLAHADGTKTAADLVVLSGMPERSALAFLAACRAVGTLDEVTRALAGTGRIGFM